MTAVADTRLLLVFAFPSTERERERIREVMHESLREPLIIPAVVVTEYVKAAGKRIGKEAAIAKIAGLKESGAEITTFDERTAVRAGELLLAFGDKPIGDAIIAATTLIRKARHVISDDPHFKELGLRTRWT